MLNPSVYLHQVVVHEAAAVADNVAVAAGALAVPAGPAAVASKAAGFYPRVARIMHRLCALLSGQAFNGKKPWYACSGDRSHWPRADHFIATRLHDEQLQAVHAGLASRSFTVDECLEKLKE